MRNANTAGKMHQALAVIIFCLSAYPSSWAQVSRLQGGESPQLKKFWADHQQAKTILVYIALVSCEISPAEVGEVKRV